LNLNSCTNIHKNISKNKKPENLFGMFGLTYFEFTLSTSYKSKSELRSHKYKPLPLPLSGLLDGCCMYTKFIIVLISIYKYTKNLFNKKIF
jgi:hypothetical protein